MGFSWLRICSCSKLYLTQQRICEFLECRKYLPAQYLLSCYHVKEGLAVCSQPVVWKELKEVHAGRKFECSLHSAIGVKCCSVQCCSVVLCRQCCSAKTLLIEMHSLPCIALCRPVLQQYKVSMSYRVSQNYVNTNGLWYHLFPAKCVSGL